MSENQILKAYGELHNTDFLLEAYYEIFMDAQKDGIKTCFIERSPFLQNDTDEIMGSLINQSLESLREELVFWRSEYQIKKSERSLFAHIYRCYLCALTGVKPVHVDVGPRPLRLHIRCDAPNFSSGFSLQALRQAAEKIDLSSYLVNPECNAEQLQQELKNAKNDLQDEATWKTALYSDVKRRLDSDHLVINRILSNLDGNPAIMIYGKNHLDFERKNSLASILAKTEGITLSVYHIVGNKLVPRSNQEFAHEPVDLPTIIEQGKSYYNGINNLKDLTEARYWLHKASRQGSPEADFYLALCYLEDGELENAFSFAQRAAHQNYIEAFSLLGQFHFDGYGTSKDASLSHLWYSKAVEAGDLTVASLIAYNYLQGCGTTKDPVKSFLWYSIGLLQKDENAAHNIKFAERQLTPEQIGEVRNRAANLFKALTNNPGNRSKIA